jgi:hypothetical protein
MPETATCTLSVALGSGQRWAVSRSLDVEAVDIITVKVDKQSPTAKKVALQPGLADKIKFMLVTSSVYPESELTFQTSDPDDDPSGDEFELDQPLLILGQGMMKMLGGLPTFLHVKNASDQDALVTVVVGRDSIAT